MNVKVITSNNFRKEAKRLIKKYPSLKKELAELETELLLNPKIGTPIGKDCYKIRLAIKSKEKGKRGGARVITYLIVNLITRNTERSSVYLLSVYDKSEFETISDKDLKRLISELNI
ncbi:MAG: hypothetical protein U9R23_03835 [Candidatus Cloacimonadota bacterium]|nr:hypothetical protein [Candidatus Cloacimonadota bacterium]